MKNIKASEIRKISKYAFAVNNINEILSFEDGYIDVGELIQSILSSAAEGFRCTEIMNFTARAAQEIEKWAKKHGFKLTHIGGSQYHIQW